MTRPASLHRLDDDEYFLRKINMGIYSWPGVGKSVFIGSGGVKMLIGDADSGGTDSPAALGSEASAVRITDYQELEDVYQFLKNDMDPEDPEFDFFWWDSVTLFQDRTLIDDLLLDAYTMNPSKQDPDVPSKREYMKSQVRIARYVRQFSELDHVNFGMSFHIMAHETPEGTVTWCPLLQGLQGEFSTKIQGYTNILGYLYTKEDGGTTNRFMRTAQSPEYVAKDRFVALPAVIKNPTIPDIRARIAKAKAERKAAKASGTPTKAAAKKAAPMPVKRVVKKAAPRPAGR